mgnify:CR=1 FL=1
MYLGKDGQFMLHKWIEEIVVPLRDKYAAFLICLTEELGKNTVKDKVITP